MRVRFSQKIGRCYRNQRLSATSNRAIVVQYIFQLRLGRLHANDDGPLEDSRTCGCRRLVRASSGRALISDGFGRHADFALYNREGRWSLPVTYGVQDGGTLLHGGDSRPFTTADVSARGPGDVLYTTQPSERNQLIATREDVQ
jgi:hypothetical protein